MGLSIELIMISLSSKKQPEPFIRELAMEAHSKIKVQEVSAIFQGSASSPSTAENHNKLFSKNMHSNRISKDYLTASKNSSKPISQKLSSQEHQNLKISSLPIWDPKEQSYGKIEFSTHFSSSFFSSLIFYLLLSPENLSMKKRQSRSRASSSHLSTQWLYLYFALFSEESSEHRKEIPTTTLTQDKTTK